MASVWFVRGGGKVYGPLDSAKLKKIVADGKIDQTTEIAQNQNGPWVPAGKVKGLFEAPPVTPAYAPKPQAYAAPQPYIPPPLAPITESPAEEPMFARIGSVMRRTLPASTYDPQKKNGMIALVVGLCSLASLALGYFAGREHIRYQMRSSLKDVGKTFVEDIQKEIGKAFSGQAASSGQADDIEEKKPEPVAELALGKTYDSDKAAITVKSAKIERPAIIGGMSREPHQHDEECLVISLAIRNKDDRKQFKVSYDTYEKISSDNVFKLHDDVGNDIQSMFFSDGASSQFQMVGAHPSHKDIDPEQSVDHVIAFKMPLPKTKSLSLVIDLKLIGQKGIIQYAIPIVAVEGFAGK